MNKTELHPNFHKYQMMHFSNSSLSLPLGKFLYWYLHKSPEDRKQHHIGEAGALGTCVHNGIQMHLCYGLELEQAIKDAEIEFDNHPACEDDVKRSRFRECIGPMINNAIVLLKQSGFTKVESERRIEINLKDIEVPIIGFVDLLGDGLFCEIKTKAPIKSAVKKDGSQGWSRGRIPKDKPEWSHIKQAAIYECATGVTPAILYTAEHEAKIFTPFNCEELHRSNLDKALFEVRQAALIKQNLIKLSDDVRKLATIVDPDWSHNFVWSDPQQRKEAEKLWEI